MFEKERISIDITTEKISILIGSKNKITLATTIETPKGAYAYETISEIEELKKAIKPVLDKRHSKTNDVYFVLRGDDLIVRTLQIPMMKEAAMEDSIRWELSQFVGERVDEYVISHKVLNNNVQGADGVGEVLMIAAPKFKIEQYRKLAKALELNMKALDIPSNLVARVFASFKETYKKGLSTVGIIDISANYSLMEILEKGKLKYEKYQSVGMASASIVPLKSNDEYLEMLSEVDLTNTEVINTYNDGRLQNILDSITRQFKSIIQFSASGRIKKDLDKIFILGSAMQIKGIGRYLERELDTTIAQVPNFDAINATIKTPDNISLEEYLYVYGLMLRGNKNELDLTIEEKKQEDVSDLRKKSSIAVAGLAVIVFAGSFCYVQGNKVLLERKKQSYLSEIDKYKELSNKEVQLTEEITLLTSHIAKSNEMKDKQTKETDKLIKGIQKITPVAISFKSLVYDRDTVSVDGFSKDQQSIEVLWANLRESDKYTNCHISNRNAVDGGYSFVLNITLPKVQEEIKSEGGNN